MKTSKSMFICALLLSAAFAVAQEAKPGFNVTHPMVPKSTETDTYGINNGGIIAGDYVDAAGIQHGMALKGTKATTIDRTDCTNTPASTSIAFYGINTAGVMAGWCLSNKTGNDVAFTWSPTTKKFTDLKVPGAVSAQATGINDKGQIVGLYIDSASATHGFFWDGKKYNTLTFTGATATSAWDINNSGIITVNVTTGSVLDGYVYNSTTKKYTKMDVPGATLTVIHAINSKGDICYTSFTSSTNRHGVLYQASTKKFYSFDDPKGVNATRADGLNDTLVLVGRSSPAAGNSVGFQAAFHP